MYIMRTFREVEERISKKTVTRLYFDGKIDSVFDTEDTAFLSSEALRCGVPLSKCTVTREVRIERHVLLSDEDSNINERYYYTLAEWQEYVDRRLDSDVKELIASLEKLQEKRSLPEDTTVDCTNPDGSVCEVSIQVLIESIQEECLSILEYCRREIPFAQNNLFEAKDIADIYEEIGISPNVYLLNAFSLQMLQGDATVKFQEVEKLPEGLKSAVGHADTAAVLGVECNRVNVSLRKGDVAYVAQLTGGRLPEGCTTLPDGFTFKFIKVDVQ